MSDERDIANYNSAVSKKGTEILQEKLAGLSKQELKAKNVRIASRGATLAALEVPNLPPEYYGEWVHLNDVIEYEGMGFVVDNEFASAMHGDGTSAKRVGDTIHMITTKENHQAIDELRTERSKAMQDPRKHVSTDVENLRTDLGKHGKVEDPNFNSQSVNMEHIKSVVDDMNAGNNE
jgi:hypothetical protein